MIVAGVGLAVTLGLLLHPHSTAFSTPDPRFVATSQAMRHRASGYLFPHTLATLTARRKSAPAADFAMVRYADGGDSRPTVSLTLSVRPAHRALEPEVQLAERALRRRWSALVPHHLILRLPAGARDARAGWWHGERRGLAAIVGLTGFAIVQRSGWTIEADAIVPDDAPPGCLARLQGALDAIVWQIGVAMPVDRHAA